MGKLTKADVELARTLAEYSWSGTDDVTFYAQIIAKAHAEERKAVRELVEECRAMPLTSANREKRIAAVEALMEPKA